MASINRTDRYHLCYLVRNSIDEDRFDGLSHVSEHTLLIPSDIGLDFVGRGYTCANHVWLYFGSEKLETLYEVDRQIMNCEIITEENVNRAKRQVEEEIIRLKGHTAKSKKLIRFATESRIQKFAMGETDQINQIQVADIRNWFEERKCQGQIYRFIFRDAHEMIESTPIPTCGLCNVKKHRNCVSTAKEDHFLFLASLSKARIIELYLRVPVLDSKEALVKKAVFEFCIQKKIQKAVGIDIEIGDKFFDSDERFSVLKFQWDGTSKVKDIVGIIRQEINGISLNEFLTYREEFIYFADAVMRQVKRNAELMNVVKNYILYSIPNIQPEDLYLIEQVEYDSFPREMITTTPIKVVIS